MTSKPCNKLGTSHDITIEQNYMNKSSLTLLALMLLNFQTYANQDSGFNYRFSKQDNHVIHILTIDPKRFELKLVKAHNQV
ncbi:MAG TPA: hypothetical protein LFW10_04130 [Rickettsia endosymbiont of Diachasma alloeum]|nr:hypothetical protein [Rickettsia endosymbiont of Diachasma alloeum]